MRSVFCGAGIVLASLLLFATGVVAAVQTVDEVVAKNLEAKGGVERLRNTTTVRTSGRASMQGKEVRITTSSKRPHFSLNVIQMEGQSIRQGFDGQTLWVAVPGAPPQAMPPGPQVEVLKQTSQIDSPLLDYEKHGTTVELAGTESEGQRRLHHLIVKPQDGPTLHYYIDAATGLESRIVMEAGEQGQKLRSEMRFSDYRTVDGRTMPFSIQQFVNGNQVGSVTFDKVEFNVPLDDAIFRMPKK